MDPQCSSKQPEEITITTPDTSICSEPERIEFQGRPFILSSRRKLRDYNGYVYPMPPPPTPMGSKISSELGTPSEPNRLSTLSSRRLLEVDLKQAGTPPAGSPPSPSQSSPRHLQTPSPNPSTPSISRYERQGYFPSSDARQTSGLRQAQSPSEPHSSPPCLSPGSYSSKDSYLSSSAYTCTSDSSSTYTLSRAETTPYKSRRQSSNSLTMVKKRRRRKTEGAKIIIHRKQRCKGTCRHSRSKALKITMEEHKNTAYWWLPQSQTAPTAPESRKHPSRPQLNRSTASKNLDKRRLMSDVAPALITRRWSSVEVGTHQMKLPRLLRKKSRDKMRAMSPVFRTSIFSSRPLSERNRSSSFTQGSRYNDIVRTISERLTVRKLPTTHMLMPTAITLRRPSVADGNGKISTTMALLTPSGYTSGETSPRSRPASSVGNQEAETEAYIVTRADIECVAELLRAHLDPKSEPYTQFQRSSRVTSISVTNKGILPTASSPTCQVHKYAVKSENPCNATSTNPRNVPKVVPKAVHKAPLIQQTITCVDTESAGQYLQIIQTKNTAQGAHATSTRSLHEVIWEERDSPRSLSCATDDERSQLDNATYCSTDSPSPGTSLPVEQRNDISLHQIRTADLDSLNADRTTFDPSNARASISKWSWQFETRGTTSANEDGFNDNRQSREVSKTSVISFPPLPRKSTMEWNSPLPDLGDSLAPDLGGDSSLLSIPNPPASTPLRRSLYDIGIDAWTGPPDPSLKLDTSKTMPMDIEEKVSWLSGVEPQWAFSRPKSVTDLKRRQSLKSSPNASARSNRTSAMGYALGSYTGARRLSSIGARRFSSMSTGRFNSSQNLKRVTIDISESQESPALKPWSKIRQDSPYPLMKPAINIEDDGPSFWSTLATRHTSRQMGIFDLQSGSQSPHSIRPISPVCDKSPLLEVPRMETFATLRRSLAWESLSSLLNNYAPSPTTVSRKQSLSNQKSVAQNSLSAILTKFPSSDMRPEDHLRSSMSREETSSPARSKRQSSLSLLQRRYPSVPKPDDSGIYNMLTGTKRKNGMECTRECQPLLLDCDACAYTMSPSVDWIG